MLSRKPQKAKALASVYGKPNLERLEKVIERHPRFASGNHSELVSSALSVYGWRNRKKFVEAVFRDPAFLKADHEAIFKKLCSTYGGKNAGRLKEIVFQRPAFREFNHESAVGTVSAVFGVGAGKAIEMILKSPRLVELKPARFKRIVDFYGPERISEIVRAIESDPNFASYDHEARARKAGAIYGVRKEQIKDIFLKHPPFAGRDHSALLNELISIYGAERRRRLVRILLNFPQFAGYNHAQRIADASKIYEVGEGRMKDAIMRFPNLLAVSKKRHEALVSIAMLPSLGLIAKSRGVDFEKRRVLDFMLDNGLRLIASPYVEVKFVSGPKANSVEKVSVEEALALMRSRKARLFKKPAFLSTLEKRFRLGPKTKFARLGRPPAS